MSSLKSAHDHQSLFSPLGFAASSVISGLVDFAIASSFFSRHALLWHQPVCRALLRSFSALRSHRSRRRPWLSALNDALLRDVRYVMPFSAVLDARFACRLSSSLVPARWRWLYGLNPMAGVITVFGALTGHGQAPTLSLLVLQCRASLILLRRIDFFFSAWRTVRTGFIRIRPNVHVERFKHSNVETYQR